MTRLEEITNGIGDKLDELDIFGPGRGYLCKAIAEVITAAREEERERCSKEKHGELEAYKKDSERLEHRIRELLLVITDREQALQEYRAIRAGEGEG